MQVTSPLAAKSANEDTPRPMRVFILSRRDLGIDEVKSRHAIGMAMDPAPYGFNPEYLSGHQVEYSISRRKGWFAEGMHALFHFDLCHAIDNLAGLRRAEVIWTVIEWEWLAASFLQKVHFLGAKPIISNSVFLSHEYGLFGRRVRALWPLLMTKCTYLTVHSKAAIPHLRLMFRKQHFSFLPFGISTQAFPPTLPAPLPTRERRRVYAIGNDRTRDWETLLKAVGDNARMSVTIVCSWVPDSLRERYPAVEFISDPSVSIQRTLLAEADVVIVPMYLNTYSGITVACEAACLGKLIICSKTGGVPSYFDDSEVIYVEPGDVDNLRSALAIVGSSEAIERARAAHRRFLRDDYSSRGMTYRYLAVSERLLGVEVSPP